MNRLQITFRDMQPVGAVEDLVRERAAPLLAGHARISSCRVVIEAPHRRHRKTMPYRVRVDVTLPGDELVATGTCDDPDDHGIHTAVRNAFDAISRRVHDYVTRRRSLEERGLTAGR
jgi:hypothetical protein